MPVPPRPHVALNAHLLSDEASYRSAGIHGYLFNTLAHLPAADPDLSFTLLVGRGRLPDHAAWRISRSRISTRHPLARIAWEQVIAPLQLAQLRPDLLHGMGYALPLMWRGPSLVTIYDLSFLRYPERLGAARRLYLRAITRVSARQARRVIAISESGKTEIAGLLGVPPGQIDVAVPGVGPEFRPLPDREVADFRIRHNLPGRFILHVGTLEPRKNLETLLHAYARLPQRPAVRLALVGGRGWQTGPIFALIEALGLQQDVWLPGYVSNEALPMWYNAADLFVYPSLYEGFGLPILEAMACGLPVIASDTTSLPEAVGPGGLLVPPLDAEAWAQAMARLLDDAALRQEQIERGRRWAGQFTWNNTARLTAAAYRRALAGHTES